MPSMPSTELKLKLILYVDECHFLRNIKAKGSIYQTMLDSLLYAIDQCEANLIWDPHIDRHIYRSNLSAEEYFFFYLRTLKWT